MLSCHSATKTAIHWFLHLSLTNTFSSTGFEHPCHFTSALDARAASMSCSSSAYVGRWFPPAPWQQFGSTMGNQSWQKAADRVHHGIQLWRKEADWEHHDTQSFTHDRWQQFGSLVGIQPFSHGENGSSGAPWAVTHVVMEKLSTCMSLVPALGLALSSLNVLSLGCDLPVFVQPLPKSITCQPSVFPR